MSVPSISTKLTQEVLSQAQPANTGVITSIGQSVMNAIQSTFNSAPVKTSVGFVTSKTGMITCIVAVAVGVWIYKRWNNKTQSTGSQQPAFQAPSQQNPSQVNPPPTNQPPSPPQQQDITHEDIGKGIITHTKTFSAQVAADVEEKPWTAWTNVVHGATLAPSEDEMRCAYQFCKNAAVGGYDWARNNETCQAAAEKTTQLAASGKQKVLNMATIAKEKYANCCDQASVGVAKVKEIAARIWNDPQGAIKDGATLVGESQRSKQAFEYEANQEVWEMCKSGFKTALNWISKMWNPAPQMIEARK